MILLMIAGALSFLAYGLDPTQQANYIIGAAGAQDETSGGLKALTAFSMTLCSQTFAGIILFGVVFLYCWLTFREGAGAVHMRARIRCQLRLTEAASSVGAAMPAFAHQHALWRPKRALHSPALGSVRNMLTRGVTWLQR